MHDKHTARHERPDRCRARSLLRRANRAREKSFAYGEAVVGFAPNRASRAVVAAYSFQENSLMASKVGAPSKSQIIAQICKDTELSRKQVAAVFESLNGVIKKSLRGAGAFTLPGLLKMKVIKKPATKEREGINPFTKEKVIFKAKPASKKVRVLPLKGLKGLVN
jgi:nucleoid DNA-binding protein